MRTTGRRTLAGIAAGALAVAGLAIVAAPSAQAAQTVAAYCVGDGSGVNGAAGNGVDPTTVQPNCSLNAGATAVTEIARSSFVTGAPVTFMRFVVTGNSTFDDTNPAWTSTPLLSADKKTITVAVAAAAQGAANTVDLFVPSAGARTVSVLTSTVTPSVSGTVPADNEFTAAGDLTVTGLGGSAQAIVSQAYYAVAPSAAQAPIGIVHLVDESGNVIPTTGAVATGLTFNTAGGTVAVGQQYTSNASGSTADCSATGLLQTSNGLVDPGNTAGVGIVTDACATVIGAGVRTQTNSGMWIELTPGAGAVAGNYTATFSLLMPNGASYPVSINYTVASPVAGSWNVEFDKASYQPGALGTATFSLTDLGGRIVPDGVGWLTGVAKPAGQTTDDSRSVDAAFNNVLTSSAWAYEDDTNNMPTYNGKNYLEFLVPGTQMDVFTLGAEALRNAGWASSLFGNVKTASASIINPTPPPFGTIMIEGTRGVGDDANRVYVEGTTTNLVGSSVTPYFRFPGETGFTAGTGVRTVDAQGNFAWQRKTGKKIAIQFREQNVTSNTVIIEAK